MDLHTNAQPTQHTSMSPNGRNGESFTQGSHAYPPQAHDRIVAHEERNGYLRDAPYPGQPSQSNIIQNGHPNGHPSAPSKPTS
ncbi:hypothetical protein JR316_0002676 [Psilocybe cubensis]|uniref:Uncharacterized protein n=1 Tax=Psilocybe cubensis TaxID=181762 RepID=A0ACB8HD02_PSICU|nr:hypothetical protein JR316_0002676 [Psilocybe cubensis]KAH9485761.1 hypothetical protein JR316_0002676 [Psilocybe cubensis]